VNDISPMRLLIKKLMPAAVFLTIMAVLMAGFVSFFYRGQGVSGADCIIDGKKLDNCVDIIYGRIRGAGTAYPAARLAAGDVSYATRYKFVEADGSDWLETFFGDGQEPSKLQEILKNDPKVDFEAFYKLNFKLKAVGVTGVTLFREGFIVFGLYGDNGGSYIIPISPSTVDRVKELKMGDSPGPLANA